MKKKPPGPRPIAERFAKRLAERPDVVRLDFDVTAAPAAAARTSRSGTQWTEADHRARGRVRLGSVRISERAAERLRVLAADRNSSQSETIETLIDVAFEARRP